MEAIADAQGAMGNSGAARECYWLLRYVMDASTPDTPAYEFAGFLSWKGYAGNLEELSGLLLGDLDDHEILPDELYIIGVGYPNLRRDIFNALKARDALLMNLIHSTTWICPSA